MFGPAPADGVVFLATGGLEATAIAPVRDSVHRRLLRGLVRRGLLADDDAQATAQWDRGSSFSVDALVRIATADRAVREQLLHRCARPTFALDRLRPSELRCHKAETGAAYATGLRSVEPVPRTCDA